MDTHLFQVNSITAKKIYHFYLNLVFNEANFELKIYGLQTLLITSIIFVMM